MNIYEYGIANPANHLDAFGLAWYDWIPGVSTAVTYFGSHEGTSIADYDATKVDPRGARAEAARSDWR